MQRSLTLAHRETRLQCKHTDVVGCEPHKGSWGGEGECEPHRWLAPQGIPLNGMPSGVELSVWPSSMPEGKNQKHITDAPHKASHKGSRRGRVRARPTILTGTFHHNAHARVLPPAACVHSFSYRRGRVDGDGARAGAVVGGSHDDRRRRREEWLVVWLVERVGEYHNELEIMRASTRGEQIVM